MKLIFANMNIVYISSEYPTKNLSNGGVGSFLYTISTAMAQKDISVTVIGVYSQKETTISVESGVEIYRLKNFKIKGFNVLMNYYRINKILFKINKGKKIDIIETPELGLAFILKNSNSKYVIRLHGGHHFLTEKGKKNLWKVFQEKVSFKKADAFVAITNYIRRETEKYLSFSNKPITQIYNPINLELFKPIPNVVVIPFQIVFVGTVYEKKGVKQLIRAFHIVKKEFPEATLEIFGKDWYYPDGTSYIEMLKEKEIVTKEIKDSIRFNGAIPYLEIPKKYEQAEVCVFPSLVEAQGLVVVEAMGMEKITIFTNAGPGVEIIEDYKTGLLCNPNDPKDIAEKIIWVFKNKEKVVQIQKNARLSVLENFNLNKIIDKNIEFYKFIGL
jgi:glycosyltransferase involved in cell wall biosynthesis